jgi:predicted HTH domain antitoxin
MFTIITIVNRCLKMECVIGTRIDDEINKKIEFIANEEKTDKSAIIRKLINKGLSDELLEFALKKYRKREISLGKASEISGLPLIDFMQKASENKIPINYSIEDLKEDYDAAFH